VVNIYNGILLSHKMGKLMSFPATWMELETLILNKVSQKDRHHMMSHTWSLKYGTNVPLQNRNRSWTWRTDLYLLGGGGGGWIGNLGLVDEHYMWSGWAMGSCCIAQRTISNHLWWIRMEDNRKRSYTYITGHFAVEQKLAEHYKSTII